MGSSKLRLDSITAKVCFKSISDLMCRLYGTY